MQCAKCTLPLTHETGFILRGKDVLCPVCAGVKDVKVKAKAPVPVANPCPKCNRPMGLGSLRCVYCGSVKEPSPVPVVIRQQA